MSEINNVHTFIPFDAKTTKRPEGQRFVKLTFKSSKKNAAAKASACTSVPFITVIDDDIKQRLIPHIVEMLERAQDDICRDLYLNGAIGVSNEQISLNAVCDYLDSAAAGDRLTSEAINEWFATTLRDNLSILVADKLRIDDSALPSDPRFKTLEQTVNQYRDHFASLAGGKTTKTIPVARSMLNVLEHCAESDDSLAARFSVRLVKMIEKQERDNADALMML